MKAQRMEAAQREAVRLGYVVTWRGNAMTMTRPADGHSGELIVGDARAVLGSMFAGDRRLRDDAERVAYMASDDVLRSDEAVASDPRA